MAEVIEFPGATVERRDSLRRVTGDDLQRMSNEQLLEAINQEYARAIALGRVRHLRNCTVAYLLLMAD